MEKTWRFETVDVHVLIRVKPAQQSQHLKSAFLLASCICQHVLTFALDWHNAFCFQCTWRTDGPLLFNVQGTLYGGLLAHAT